MPAGHAVLAEAPLLLPSKPCNEAVEMLAYGNLRFDKRTPDEDDLLNDFLEFLNRFKISIP